MIRFVFLILLAIATAIHLKASWDDEPKLRGITKPWLLIFIILYYLTAGVQVSWVLVAALATSWLGDVLLIPKGDKWFIYGGISFELSHILFILVYATNISFTNVLWWVVIPVAVVYYTIAGVVIYKVTPTTPKPMVPPMYMYLLCNSTMNVFSLMQLLSQRSAGALVAYIGAILFFISDCTLFLVRYYKDPSVVFKKHFTVMATYVVGELLITIGIVLLSRG